MSRGVGMPMVEENVVQKVGPWGARSHVCVGKKWYLQMKLYVKFRFGNPFGVGTPMLKHTNKKKRVVVLVSNIFYFLLGEMIQF